MYIEYGEENTNELKQLKLSFVYLGLKMKVNALTQKKCRYWNKGYCREGTFTQGCQQRHRKKCKYWDTKPGCF